MGRRHPWTQEGFALPSILIAAVVMMIVMLAAVQTAVSIDVAMKNGYHVRLANEAAQSGLVLAQACLKKSDGVVTWTNAKPLGPNTDCEGDVRAECPGADACYILKTGALRTSFQVKGASVSQAGSFDILSTGSVEQLRTSNGASWRTYTADAKTVFAPTQLRWKQSSTSGYGASGQCAIALDNRAYCWGRGAAGRLGNGSTVDSSVPVAVSTSGALSGKTIKSISVGVASACAIASDDNAYCWGEGSYGRLGNGSTVDSSVPVAVSTSGALSGKTIKSISAGDTSACAIASDDNAYCWGYGFFGALGNGWSGITTAPVPVLKAGALSGKTITSISVGYSAACAIASDNNAYCWGTGPLGNGWTLASLVPVPVWSSGALSGKTITSISVGYSAACAIASDSNAYCWGSSGIQGALGNGWTLASLVPVPVWSSGALSGKTIKAISAGYYGACAIASDDNAYCWGEGAAGRLGNGSTADSSVPVAVSTSGALSGKTIKSVSVGEASSCAIASDDNAYCWGEGSYGRLGNGSTIDSPAPVAMLPMYGTSLEPVASY